MSLSNSISLLLLPLLLLVESTSCAHNAVLAARYQRRARTFRQAQQQLDDGRRLNQEGIQPLEESRQDPEWKKQLVKQRQELESQPRFFEKTPHMRKPDELEATQGACREEFDCSAGCIAVMGNGYSITRGQAAMALQCDRVYRANFMDSAHTCAKRATHCFHHHVPDGFVGIKRNASPEPSTFGGHGQARRLGIQCENMVWENRDLDDFNMTWDGPSESFSSLDVKETMGKYFDRNELVEGRQPKNLFRKPSSGMYMIAHALKFQGDKCVHIFGFNFWNKPVTGQKQDHPFLEEKRLVQRMLRMRERVFFHPMLPVQDWHTKGELHYGL